jgi:LemA protein
VVETPVASYIVVATFLVFIIYIVSIYNALVLLRNHISDAWSNVGTELTRRYELIPNLVAAVKGYAAHEQETLKRVIELRNSCIADNGSVGHQEATEKFLVGAMQ